MTGVRGTDDGRGTSVPSVGKSGAEKTPDPRDSLQCADLDTRLDAALNDLAVTQTFTTYGTLARTLNIPGPGAIARLTAALERTMAQDAGARHPLRAARVLARVPGTLPAPGFFAHARALNLYHGRDTGQDAEAFHRAQLVR